MERFDFVIVGAGPAGEAAAYLALGRGRSVAIVERWLVGGACPFWACMPSKTLLHAAAVHALGPTYPWSRASARRDYMINREPPRTAPDDSGHVHDLQRAGATVIRGSARLDGPGRVVVALADGAPRELAAPNVVLAVGSGSRWPPIEDLAATEPWTNIELTSTRELPRSLLILGGGPTGVELSQVFARYGVPVTLVESNPRILARDHPRNSEAIRAGLERDGVTIRAGVRALKALPHGGHDGAHRVELGDGSSVEGHRILVSIGRTFPLAELGLESVGLDPGDLQPDGRLRLGEGLWVVGDPAGPELHTHVSHYQGELAVRMALGDDVRPDYRAIPRCVYTDPEAAFTGLTLEQAREAGHDAVEFHQPFATTSKGYVSEMDVGHVTIVVDRQERTLIGAAIAGPPGSSEAIHEAVLAVKAGVPLAVLADTIHAFPTTARVMGLLFAQADRELA
ncbi:MAG: dihydrolipoyl dehydrogenase family protein [Candidatus Limnocylindrales bacterium]